MNKVTRFRLICCQTDEAGTPIDYQEIYKLLWQLQDQTRIIKNKAIQICWDFENRSRTHFQETGAYLNQKEEFGMTLRGYLNWVLKAESFMYSGNTSCTTDTAYSEFQSAKLDIFRGTRSVLSYKGNQPLELHNKTVRLSCQDGAYMAEISLLNKAGMAYFGFSKSSLLFRLEVRDNSQKAILDRCLDKGYKITASRLVYDQRGKRWCLNLGYAFTPEQNSLLDPSRILGVDLGIHYPICASVHGEWPRFTVDGGEIEEFRSRVDARKRSLLRQGKYCGEGRIGHGRNTRCKPADDIEDKIARFRNTCNHKYSKALIDFAIRQRCGTIQIEDLSGITDHANRFLKNWSYFDLQTKIEYKAQQAGIRVIRVKPRYTSQRCSKCGHIDRENRPDQQTFRCTNPRCGFSANADYNASQNLSIPGIDKIIEKAMVRTES